METIINGKKYEGNSVEVKDGEIIIDGEVVDTIDIDGGLQITQNNEKGDNHLKISF